MTNFLSDNSFLLLEKSMGYLWTKQAAILDNIANAETPNYRAKTVSFEENLKERLEEVRYAGSRKRFRDIIEDSEFAVVEHAEATRMDDNSVNVTEQSVEMARTAYQLQYVLNAINGDLSELRTVVRGQ